MFVSPSQLRTSLRKAGISTAAIEAAWPQWWSDDAASSASANAELRFTLARRLGLSPTSLLDEEPTFLWRNDAKFKSLATTTEGQEAALTSFGLSAGKLALDATPPGEVPTRSASVLREALLAQFEFVDLFALLTLCWGVGIPVAQLEVFPLDGKYMHAMSVADGDRNAILLGRKDPYAAQRAFTIAHELGHIFLDHFSGEQAVVDMESPTDQFENDAEETAATEFAMELLTGFADFRAETESETFKATQLARAAIERSTALRIEPGVIALSLGHTTGRWEAAIGALKVLAGTQGDPPSVNDIAQRQLQWDGLSDDGQIYLRRLLGLAHDA